MHTQIVPSTDKIYQEDFSKAVSFLELYVYNLLSAEIRQKSNA